MEITFKQARSLNNGIYIYRRSCNCRKTDFSPCFEEIKPPKLTILSPVGKKRPDGSNTGAICSNQIDFIRIQEKA